MAEKMLLAFGRYLKLVRERRKLSLEDVATLTKSYPEPINKGYLSRVERGLARVGFSKMVALSHAYEVSLDAFGEKLALDLEVDRMRDAPDTKGKTFGELTEMAIAFRRRGMRWHAYAVLRDAVHRASQDELFGSFRSQQEQIVSSVLSVGAAVAGLGRHALALSELEFVQGQSTLVSEDNLPIVFQQLARAKHHFGLIQEATELAKRGIELAEKSSHRTYLGAALETQARLASHSGDHESAIELYKRAFVAYKDIGSDVDCARTLNNLAQNYFDVGRHPAARRALRAAERIAAQVDASAIRARSRILLGEIELLSEHPARAAALWHEALEFARETRDGVVHFKAEFQLFKLAIRQENPTIVNSLGRRLQRLAPWISPNEPEVAEFRKLYAIHRKPKQRSVAATQH